MNRMTILRNVSDIFPEIKSKVKRTSYGNRRYASDPVYREKIKETARQWNKKNRESK